MIPSRNHRFVDVPKGSPALTEELFGPVDEGDPLVAQVAQVPYAAGRQPGAVQVDPAHLVRPAVPTHGDEGQGRLPQVVDPVVLPPDLHEDHAAVSYTHLTLPTIYSV